jgi:iron(III) transport system substrate-binding protein
MLGKRLIVAGLQAALLLGLFSLAGAASPSPLEQVIEGAKKEGAVSVVLRSSFTPKSMERLEKEIKERFGVDLKIQYSPSASMSKALAEALMESKVGASPTYDLMNFSNHVIDGMEAGILERVDWKPLLTKDTNPEVVMGNPAFRGALTYYTSYQGLMYNTQKVPSDKVPKTLRELAAPKWKGKIGVNRGPDAWPRWAFVLGKDRVYSDLRALLKNGAIQGQYSELQNRYLLGEIWMAFTISSYMNGANEKGVPTKWQCLDLGEVQNFSISIRKGAKHPNAARLVALYLASPQGAKFTLEESNAGNLFYPGNYENDIRVQNAKQGMHDIFIDRNQKIIDAYKSKEFDKLAKEVDMILKTGGEQ